MTGTELLKMAKEASKMAYSPYSNVRVGAALQVKSGKVYTGVNVENSSYGGTICAERTAAVKAISEGEKVFERIAVAGSIKNLVPCGMCRQFLSEFCDDMEIYYENEAGEMVETTLGELLPSGFSLKKKTIAILGDSYSTYEGFMPSDYEAWYKVNGNSKPNNVDNVEQTWWWQLCQNRKLDLIANCSYSGSPVCNTGYEGVDASDHSFIKRMKREFGNISQEPDMLIVFGVTNDFWAGSPIGEEKYEEWTTDELKEFAPAFCYMMNYLRNKFPHTDIYNVLNDDIQGPIRELAIKISEKFNVVNICLSNIEKENGHPNISGMAQIYEQINKAIQ